MSKHRHSLPLHRGGNFLTCGGMETTLIFHRGIELPHFASFVLLDSLEAVASFNPTTSRISR
jgi:homocysteine S-methyltransferase